MYVLTRAGWQDHFLDAAPRPGLIMIRPIFWYCLGPVVDQYFERPRSLGTVWSYWKELGTAAVVAKIRSRLAEADRNDKYLSVGAGSLIDSEGRCVTGRLTGFIAPNHPRCQERILAHEDLVFPLAESSLAESARRQPDEIAFLDAPVGTLSDLPMLASLAGWSPDAGSSLPAERAVMQELVQRLLSTADWGSARRLSGVSSPAFSRHGPVSESASGRPRAVLFGYGNYAKTIILPNVARYLAVSEIHEADPLQIPNDRRPGIEWSTYPDVDELRGAAAVLIAGFHHTHADLAIRAMECGAAAVVEKPLATTREQAHALLQVLSESDRRRLYACFHRRYSPANDWLREDLGINGSQPLSYHCIVFEEPLPALHWYRWPASRGRLVSNGCHWIDHFLYLNGYAEVTQADVRVARDGTVNSTLTLVNGAVFTMVLTDLGASRTGMQNYVEIRAKGGTVRLVNDVRYEADTASRSVRRSLGTRLRSYENMYREIARRIIAGEPGDTRDSVQRTIETVLQLEELAQEVPAYSSHGRP